MLTVELSQIAADKNTLRLGVVVRYGDNGPVRFAQVVVPGDSLEWQELSTFASWVARVTNAWLDRESELDEQDSLPGM